MHVRVLTSLGIAFTLLSPPSASAQWDPRDEAVGRCQQELQYRMGREVGGRQPNASIDERRAQITRVSNTEARVRGNGRYMRDSNDRGRDFSFDCTFNSRNNSARATYNWSGSGWGGQYPDPDPGYNRPRPEAIHRMAAYSSAAASSAGSAASASTSRDAALAMPPISSSGAAAAVRTKRGMSIDLGRGQFSIISHGSNKALTVSGGSSDGANVEQNRWNGGDNQRWRVERAGSGAYRIVSVSNNSCLDVEGAKRDDGANIQLWGCSGGANQTWLFRK